jgi:hypothetical protein
VLTADIHCLKAQQPLLFIVQILSGNAEDALLHEALVDLTVLMFVSLQQSCSMIALA